MQTKTTSREGRGGVFLPLGVGVLLVVVATSGSVVKLLSAGELASLCTAGFVSGSSGSALRWAGMGVAAAGMAGAWILLRRRFAPVYAAVGCLVIMATPALDYSYDARTIFGSLDGIGWLVTASLLGAAVAGALARYGLRRVAGWMVAALTLAIAGRQAACGLQMRHQRNAFFQFRDGVERAAAPGEAVVVRDTYALAPLYWYSSPALRQELVFAGPRAEEVQRVGSASVRSATLASLLHDHAELVIVAAPGDWLVNTLRARGYMLTEDVLLIPWERLQGVRAPLAKRETRIFLATPRLAVSQARP